MEDAIQEHHVEALLREQGFQVMGFEPLPGDVSSRRYARVEVEGLGDAIFAWYPETLRDACSRFRTTTRLLEELGVRVPRVLGGDCTDGWMLVEDGGNETLYDRRDRPIDERRPLFERAVEITLEIATLPCNRIAAINPALDSSLLRRELEQTLQVFLAPGGFLPTESIGGRFRTALTELSNRLGDLPLSPCHRDFMSRNLIPGPDGELWLIDHQDLRLGPPFYDLASLLNDSFFPTRALEAQLRDPALGSSADEALYHRAAAQRTLKAVGTFASFARRGNKRHLPLVPPTLTRALDHLERLPETAELARELRPIWTEALEKDFGDLP